LWQHHTTASSMRHRTATGCKRHHTANGLLASTASISHGVRPAAALDLPALIPIVGAATSQRLFFYLWTLSISLVSLTQEHTHDPRKSNKALPWLSSLAHTKATFSSLSH
jgi:hypothetical protein